MKKLSIIIPSYKETKKQIQETLLSIDMQKRINFSELEVIVVNDSGNPLYENNTITDFDCLRNFSVKYIYNSPNGGPLKARQCGFDHSTAQYIQFVDAEDSFINTFYLQWVLDVIENNDNLDAIFSGILKEELINNQYTYSNEVPFFYSFHGKTFNRDFINKNIVWLKERAVYAEDEYFLRQVFDSLSTYFAIEQPHYFYKFNQNSLVHTYGKSVDDYYPIKFPEYLEMMSKYLKVVQERKNELLPMRAIELIVKVVLHLHSNSFKQSEGYIKALMASKEFYNQ